MWALVVVLLFLPAVGAAVVACLGSGRALLARQISLGVTLGGAAIAFILMLGFLAYQDTDKQLTTFAPMFVPGSTITSSSISTRYSVRQMERMRFISRE